MAMIETISTHIVTLPYRHTFTIAGGANEQAAHLLVLLKTDDGATGIGEAACMPAYGDETVHTVDTTIRDRIAPELIGKDVTSRHLLWEIMTDVASGHPFARAAVDCAIWDAYAKSIQVPLYELLGGKMRSHLDLVWVCGMKDAQDMVQEAKHYYDLGYKTIKIKVGTDPDTDLENVKAVRAALPSAHIKVDGNQGYDFATAKYILPRLEQFDLRCIEQPLPRTDLDGLKTLTQMLKTPIMADESLFDPYDAITLVRERACDVFNIKVAKTGITGALEIAAIAGGAGVSCMIGSMIEFGPGTAAALGFGISCRLPLWPCELVGPLLLSGDVIEANPFSDEVHLGGKIAPAGDENGIGVTLNPGVIDGE